MNHKTFIKFLGLPPLFTSALLLSLLSSCGDSTDNQTSGQAGDSEELSLKKLVIALKANKNPASMLAEKEEAERSKSFGANSTDLFRCATKKIQKTWNHCQEKL